MKIIAGREFYSCEDVAKKIGYHIKTIQKWLRTGILKGKKVGGEWLVDVFDYDRLLSVFV